VLSDNVEEILNDDRISIIVEATNDTKSAYQYIKRALTLNKSVVTANKALVSAHFEELSMLAERHHVSFLYEASVGGGIPILKALKDEVILNDISSITGILNGTCNYILSNMFNNNTTYNQALNQAQELGFAEFDPHDDVSGKDTQRKLRILATLGLSTSIKEKDIILHGIEQISTLDIQHIQQLQSTCKLIGEVVKHSDHYYAVVMPCIVCNSSYFSTVNMAYNAVCIRGSHIENLTFYGAGAGASPTADAMMKDVLDVAKGGTLTKSPLKNNPLLNRNETWKDFFYLRINSNNPKLVALIKVLADQVLQQEKQLIILSKKIEYNKVRAILSKYDIKSEEYFIARIK
jgi:homoserine dehydrogenase